jgi:hypothetical protein
MASTRLVLVNGHNSFMFLNGIAFAMRKDRTNIEAALLRPALPFQHCHLNLVREYGEVAA